jgi:uncharacterized protein (TIGR03067 family)
MRVLLACGLGVLLVASAVTGGDDKSDLAKLKGSWIVEKDGKKSELKFDQNNFTFTLYGDFSVKGTFKIDASKKPKHMDMTITEGQEYVGKTSRAIYALEGDTLKWCANEPGKEDRAGEFPAKEGEGKYLYLIFKRAK